MLIEHTALTLRELLEANPGAQVQIADVSGGAYAANVLGVPTRSAEELEANSPPGSGEMLPEKANLILLKTVEGVAAIPFEQIRNFKFKGNYKPKIVGEEFRNLLTLKLEWPGGRVGKTADVGMMYLQKGIRWIPSYKIRIDGKGDATVSLQATLINELADLDDVTANLVIGVPTFFFQDTPDPISLQQAFAQLSPYFQTGSQTNYAFSNAIMTQSARAGERLGGMPGPAGAPPIEEVRPGVAGSARSEDLYVFTVKHVTLKKGQRMVLPVAEYTLKYKDVFTLDLPIAPPIEVRRNINNEQQAELARLLNAPKVEHKIRLSNKSGQPLTTAPALIIHGDRLLAQGMMTYTASGSDVDLAVTAAPDIRVKKTEKETKRTPNAAEWNGSHLGRVDLTGTIGITNYRDQAVDLEVTRSVLGTVGAVDHGGVAEMVNLLEDGTYAGADSYPSWWNWYNWPQWWNRFNGIGRFTWKLKLDPGKSVDLGYNWWYYWQ